MDNRNFEALCNSPHVCRSKITRLDSFLFLFTIVITENNLYVVTSFAKGKHCAIHHGGDIIWTTERQLEMVVCRHPKSPRLGKEGCVVNSLPRYDIEHRWLICGHHLWGVTGGSTGTDGQLKVRECLELLLGSILQVCTYPYFRDYIVSRGPRAIDHQNSIISAIAYWITYSRWWLHERCADQTHQHLQQMYF